MTERKQSDIQAELDAARRDNALRWIQTEQYNPPFTAEPPEWWGKDAAGPIIFPWDAGTLDSHGEILRDYKPDPSVRLVDHLWEPDGSSNPHLNPDLYLRSTALRHRDTKPTDDYADTYCAVLGFAALIFLAGALCAWAWLA